MLNVHKSILITIIISLITIFGYFVSDIIGIVNLSGFLKDLVYVVSIIIIFDILFILVLVKYSVKREKESAKCSKNIARQASKILKIDEEAIEFLDAYDFLGEFLGNEIKDEDIPNYDADYFIRAASNIYGIKYNYKKEEIIRIQLQDEYVYEKSDK